MRTCPNCHTEVPEGEVFCPECGQEIQLVADYETMESRIHEKQQIDREERDRKKQERLTQKKIQEERNRRIKRRNRNIVITILLLVVIGITAGAGFMVYKSHNSFSYQYSKAESSYRKGLYDEAIQYLKAAFGYDSDNVEAELLLAKIYLAQGKAEEGIALCNEILAKDPSNKEVYDILISYYENKGQFDAIKELLTNCQDADIKAAYAEYLCEDPSFSLPSGTYSEEQFVTITAKGSETIYYTTDGSDPNKNSTKYEDVVAIPEGTVLIRAIAYSYHGIASNITEVTYTVALEVPSAPKVYPQSGTYTAKTKKSITIIVPTGYTAYYEFDQRPTTNSYLYTGPVDMPEGTHVFYAILVNSKGKVSDVTSCTYQYSKVTPTPTATPKPTQTPKPTVEPTETPEPTPEPTETPEPTPTETPEPTPGPTDSPVPESE